MVVDYCDQKNVELSKLGHSYSRHDYAKAQGAVVVGISTTLFDLDETLSPVFSTTFVQDTYVDTVRAIHEEARCFAPVLRGRVF